MAKITPSKEKMRLAHKFAAELQKHMGNNLKAVFVYGSVAANMAVPRSDIDVLAVYRDNEFAKKVMETSMFNPRWLQLTNKIRLSQIEEGYFKDINFIRSGAGRMLLEGAIPIFGKEYAMQHPNSWRFPNAQTIRERYFGKHEPKYFGPEPTTKERLGFKRRKSARVVGLQLKRK